MAIVVTAMGHIGVVHENGLPVFSTVVTEYSNPNKVKAVALARYIDEYRERVELQDCDFAHYLFSPQFHPFLERTKLLSDILSYCRIKLEYMNGTVKWYSSKGFGVILGSDGKKYFVHRSELSNVKWLRRKDKVSFWASIQRGKPSARTVIKYEEI